MNMKFLIAAFAVILAMGSVAVRVVLDTPSAFAESQSTSTQKHAAEHNHEQEHEHGHEKIGPMYMLGDLAIENVVARETVPGAKVGGGYLIITNNGGEADTFVSGATDIADELQIHEMKMEGDVMKMRQLEQGIVIEPGASVTLKPGGLHIMFMSLQSPLEKDASFKATLNFAKAGSIDVEFKVMDTKHFMTQHSHSH